MATGFAVLFALVSANLNALAAVCQRRATGQVHRSKLFHHKIVTSVLKNRLWLIGIALEVAGFFAQAFALHYGPLTLVEPIIVSDIVFLLLFLHFVFNNPVDRQGFVGVGLLVAGLTCLILVAHPRSGGSPPGFEGSILAILIVALIILVAALAMRRIRQIPLRATVGGFAAGLHFAFTATFTKLVVTQLQDNGALATLFSWQLLGLIIVGVSSALTMQSMYGAGPLAITQPALEITEALAGIEIGVLLFSDQVNSSVGALTVEALSGLVAAVGIVMLGRSTNLQKKTKHAAGHIPL